MVDKYALSATADVWVLVERLLDISQNDDHARGCQGRQYTCTCGFDDRAFATADEAASLIQSQAARISELEAGLLVARKWMPVGHRNGLTVTENMERDAVDALLNGERKG